MSDKGGYIYILSNPSMPGVLKIGKTKRRPDIRVRELSSATGVPTPFQIEGVIEASDMSAVEKEIHRQIASSRVSNRREFFKIGTYQAVRIARKVAAKSKSRFQRKRQDVYFRFVDPVLFSVMVFTWVFTLNPTAAYTWILLACLSVISGIPKIVSEVTKFPSLFGNYTRVICGLGAFVPIYVDFDRERIIGMIKNILDLPNIIF